MVLLENQNDPQCSHTGRNKTPPFCAPYWGHLDFPSAPQTSALSGSGAATLLQSFLGCSDWSLFYEWAGYAHHLLFAFRALPFEPLWVMAPSRGFL